jgi:transposase-like protein
MKYSNLSAYNIRKIIDCFYLDLTASQSVEIAGFSRNTVNRFFNIFREAILFASKKEECIKMDGEIELDESYFGARRVRGKRGRGAAGKTIVFGVLRRDDRVFLRIVPNVSREGLMPIVPGKILEGSTLYTDGWKAYNGLILNGYDHYRIFHHENEFARGKNHVNGIEGFWAFARGRLSKFKGLASDRFILHLKECELRYNNRKLNKKEFETMILKLTGKYLKNKDETRKKNKDRTKILV